MAKHHFCLPMSSSTVSKKILLTTMLCGSLFLSGAYCRAADATFSWTANTETNLAGYKIHYGTASRTYTQADVIADKTATTHTVTSLTEGTTYYFAATAYDTDNFESDYSTEITWTAPAASPDNQVPTANNSTIELNEGTTFTGTLSAVDPDNDSLTYSIVSNPAHGTVNLTSTAGGAYTYTPAPAFSGPDSFTFQVNDGYLNSNIATVSCTVTAVNAPPTAADGIININEGTTFTGTLSAVDPDNDSLTYSIVSNPAHGTVNLTGTAGGAYTYTPAPAFSGPDSFTFRANDGALDSNIATVSVTVNAPGTGTAQATFSWTANTETNLAGYKIHYGTASRTYTQTDVIADKTATTHTVTNLTEGTTYYFAATAYDTDNFESDFSDEIIWTAATQANEQPVASGTSFSTNEGTAFSGTLTATDPEGASLTYKIVSQPSLGALILTDSGTGAYTYTPLPNAYGTDSFTFQVNDGENDSNVALVNITIHPINTPPVAIIKATQNETTPFLVNYSASTSYDPDGFIAGYSWNFGDGSTHTAASSEIDHTYSIAGVYTVALTVTDNEGGTAQDITTITIVGEQPQEPPIAAFNLDVSDLDTTLVNFDANASYDPDGSITSYSWNFGDGETGSGMYASHAYTASGNYSVTLTVMDDDGETNREVHEVVITIEPQELDLTIENGQVTADGEWQTVTFSAPFSDPVVVAKPASANDESPCVIQIRNVTVNSFDLRLKPWDYLTEEHQPETVSYLVMERGIFTLDNGIKIEASKFVTDKTEFRGTGQFSQTFLDIPVMIASLTTANEDEPVVGRMRHIDETSYEYMMREEQLSDNDHLQETVSYIAWEPASGTLGETTAYEVNRIDGITDIWQTHMFTETYSIPPLFLADMQTTSDADPANLCYQELAADQVQLRVNEEQSTDADIGHSAETVGMIIIGVGVTQNADQDLDNDVDGADLSYYLKELNEMPLRDFASQFGRATE